MANGAFHREIPEKLPNLCEMVKDTGEPFSTAAPVARNFFPSQWYDPSKGAPALSRVAYRPPNPPPAERGPARRVTDRELHPHTGGLAPFSKLSSPSSSNPTWESKPACQGGPTSELHTQWIKKPMYIS